MRLFLMVFVIALALYALIDCVRTPEEDMPARMPKHLWITLILMFSTIMLGPLAWIITSRVSAAEKRGGQLSGGLWSAEKGVDLHLSRHASTPAAPDDDPEFLRKLDEQVQAEKRRRQREQLQQNRSQRPQASPNQAGREQAGQSTKNPAEPTSGPQDSPQGGSSSSAQGSNPKSGDSAQPCTKPGSAAPGSREKEDEHPEN
ncbi:MAG: hypothetical protein KH147_03625 [Actinomyces graevenitzii]|nr:hypothetical protein [Actinomyces graevenitzii]